MDGVGWSGHCPPWRLAVNIRPRCAAEGARRANAGRRRLFSIVSGRDSMAVPRAARPVEVVGLANIPLTEEEREEILTRVRTLELEHKDLDDVIARLTLDPGQDSLQLRRLKKRKLMLKDQIARLRDRLIPDIIA
jgi:hypothetical protein